MTRLHKVCLQERDHAEKKAIVGRAITQSSHRSWPGLSRAESKGHFLQSLQKTWLHGGEHLSRGCLHICWRCCHATPAS